jgi:cytosine deaminase
MPPERLQEVAQRLWNAGVAVTVLPSTDLYLGGRDQEWGVRRNVADANALSRLGVLCSIPSNNILNPFTPMGDGQLIRQANLYANTAQRASPEELADVWSMFTENSARLMRRAEYGIAPGKPADFVLVDAPSAVDALREIAPTLGAWKRGRRSFTRGAPVLHRP